MKLKIIIAVFFLLLVAVLALAGNISTWLLGVYAGASLITFIVYAVDKSASRKRGQRTPETTLHVLSLIGGWPGALIAQETLRHKTRKQPFRLVHWLMILLNCGLFVWLLRHA